MLFRSRSVMGSVPLLVRAAFDPVTSFFAPFQRESLDVGKSDRLVDAVEMCRHLPEVSDIDGWLQRDDELDLAALEACHVAREGHHPVGRPRCRLNGCPTRSVERSAVEHQRTTDSGSHPHTQTRCRRHGPILRSTRRVHRRSRRSRERLAHRALLPTAPRGRSYRSRSTGSKRSGHGPRARRPGSRTAGETR